jgi:hypothetical protein
MLLAVDVVVDDIIIINIIINIIIIIILIVYMRASMFGRYSFRNRRRIDFL